MNQEKLEQELSQLPLLTFQELAHLEKESRGGSACGSAMEAAGSMGLCGVACREDAQARQLRREVLGNG